MRPKAKAIELTNKFTSKTVFNVVDEKIKEQKKQGKKLAILCVDEILNDELNVYKENSLNYKYWKEVKKQINLL